MEAGFEIEKDVIEDDIGPEKIVFLKNPDLNMMALLVIDNSAYGVPAGGIRFAQNITLDEMIRLARAMTMKFCTFNIPTGGAKAGIIGDPLDKDRGLKLTAFAEAISPLLFTSAMCNHSIDAPASTYPCITQDISVAAG